ncbi:MAG: glycosyltransferase family 4 protein [Candidatus Kariarchaeaceae archaeon]
MERHVYTLSKYLAENGNDVTILTETQKQEKPPLELNGIKIQRTLKLSHRKTALQWVYQYLRNSHTIKEAINDHSGEYDIIHYHGTHMLYFDKIHIKSPLIATIHGIFPACISFWGINNWCENEPSPINCANCMVKLRKNYAPFYPGMILYNKYYYNRMKESLGAIDKIISVSDYVKNIVEKSLNLDNIITKYNFIDRAEIINYIKSEPIQSTDLSRNTNKTILYSGRLHFQKGITTLLDSYRIIKKENINARLLISGKGELDNLVTQHSIEHEGIEYLGFLSRETQLNQLNHSNVFVAPSTYPDACPTAIIEAMALGVPVVSTTVGGIPELIINEKTGYLVKPNDSNALAEKIKRALGKNKDFWRKNCIEQSKTFDIKKIGHEIIKIYEKLI